MADQQIDSQRAQGPLSDELPAEMCIRDRVAGARVMAGAEAWSDFLVQPDGVVRFLLRDVSLR